MNRELTEDEKNIYNLFKDQLNLKQNKEYSQITLNVKKQKFFVSNPVVYDIEGTDSILILGEPRQAVNIEMLKRFYEEELKKKIEQANVKECKNENINEDNNTMKEECIQLIQSQIDKPREEIEKILEECDYDVVKTMSKLSK
ncbi:Nascent polypeptide-associated complex subunit alpha [Nosema granulosis]|uniref:Nascent polypeptide-associated complex subunit alpha n=1 Tax=Nosema granulosis TaxID=83296 RepID=A0A9P6GXW7_9MICR|nr:Nascent polypeptide-associated complex subunit alpha [Nosema granulosis]